ncbi:hydroxymethylpyrimidine/phosphomethylpyrimidine kinase [Bartonella sp. HY761]|uniref:hydroxymethylpyrimidine/phosphomethylpyrimidine kinase n=1 Tax=Bartonella sp. HY761 TaxID=2979330 RepID=UPI002209DC57|nr:hydroxymethylpyrimidine/phosphomethylpyrimidine kinase [Bartonella sp. HY761]UXN05615.1 hydroxymethylpyrimidine/phosphomethylpyrimidine kinase [Bartonella sp. HY761]
MTFPNVLIIAGSDSSGGAGVVRDIETANHLFCKSSVAITAVTAQTDQGVIAVEPMEPLLLEQQIEAARIANPIAAVKIGMVATVENSVVLQNQLACIAKTPIIFDPVLVASSGGPLSRENLVEAITARLLPYIDILTPNIIELATLLGDKPAPNDDYAIKQAKQLLHRGVKAILVKGGHLDGLEARDYLVTNEDVITFSQPRLAVLRRGTGCTLSTAIACYMASGDSLSQAIGRAKDFLYAQLLALV